MTSKQSSFPRLDLAKNHIDTLTFSCFLTVHSETTPRIDLSDLLEAGRFFSVTPYSRGKVRHVIVESVDAANPELGPFVWVRYETRSDLPGRLPPKIYRHEGKLVQRFNDVSQEFTMSCQVDFSIAADLAERSASWFPLPVTLSDLSPEISSPISEIRGIHGYKLKSDQTNESEQVDYSFILDRPRNQDVYLSIEFSLTSTINNNVPQVILERALSIAKTLGFFQT